MYWLFMLFSNDFWEIVNYFSSYAGAYLISLNYFSTRRLSLKMIELFATFFET